MTLVLIFLLVLLWGAVIVPTLLRARQSPSSSVGTFRKNMQALGARSSARGPRYYSSSANAGVAGRWILGPPVRRQSRGYRPSPARDAHSPAASQPRAVASSRRGSGGISGGLSGGWDDLNAGALTLEQRRTIFFGLVAAAAFTLLLGFAYGLVLRIHLGVDVALIGYVVYLVRTKPRRESRDLVTRHTPAMRRPEARPSRGRDEGREWLRAGEL